MIPEKNRSDEKVAEKKTLMNEIKLYQINSFKVNSTD